MASVARCRITIPRAEVTAAANASRMTTHSGMYLLRDCEQPCSRHTQSHRAGSSMVWRVYSEGVLDGKVAVVTGTSRGVGVGIAHELLRAGATVIGCSRSKLEALPGVDQDESWRRRSAQMVCDQGDYRAIDAMVTEVADTYGRIDILVNNAGGTVPTPDVEDVPALVQRIQGAPRADDDFERTALFHAFAIQMNLVSPLWFALRVYRQMRDQDGVGSI